jgi:hypothetical protein
VRGELVERELVKDYVPVSRLWVLVEDVLLVACEGSITYEIGDVDTVRLDEDTLDKLRRDLLISSLR